MRSVKKDFDNPPKHLQSKNCQKKIKEILHEKKGDTISHHYYGHSTVRNNLEKLYHGKCAYCETKVAGSVLRIDHYRPKDKYYWLGYEWSNLLPACEKCNRAKSNAFPLEVTGIKVTQPPLGRLYWQANSHTLLAEKPLLLNPEIDQPESHFIFLPNGKMKPLTKQAETTININKLNRSDLIIARKTVVDHFRNKMRQLADDFIETVIQKETLHYSLKLLFNDILKAQSAEKTYSQLSWFMFKKFEIFFLKTLGTKQQKIINNAFQLFKNGKL
jgi:uncharacterized protein (TIGR02646 family)